MEGLKDGQKITLVWMQTGGEEKKFGGNFLERGRIEGKKKGEK